MANVASLAPKMLHPEQVTEQKVDDKPWLRMRQEPALWYMRFRRYLELGPKRSMRAALAAEPDAKRAAKGDKAPALKLSDISVPGAWSRAAKVWNWRARVEAYDLHETSMYAQVIRETANSLPYSSCAFRIMALNEFAIILRAQIKVTMDADHCVNVITRLQSIMRDIAAEMVKLDGVTKDACDSGAALYVEKEMLEQKTQAKMKSAAMPDALIMAIEAEEARRALEEEKP